MRYISDEEMKELQASQTGTEETGTNETGTNETGTNETGTNETGTNETGTNETGTNETGTNETGTNETGTEETGTNETGSLDGVYQGSWLDSGSGETEMHTQTGSLPGFYQGSESSDLSSLSLGGWADSEHQGVERFDTEKGDRRIVVTSEDPEVYRTIREKIENDPLQKEQLQAWLVDNPPQEDFEEFEGDELDYAIHHMPHFEESEEQGEGEAPTGLTDTSE